MHRRVLIVDDIRANREILKRILSGTYDILEASDGETAMALLRQEAGELSAVLLDISMPGVDGYQVLRQIRADARMADLPVIMITGTGSEDARIAALSLGANDFVTKPYNSEILKHCLRNNIAFREAAATVADLRRDKVTGLYNREAFFQQIGEVIARREPGYYMMTCLNIDKFKVINDQYGTEKGDQVLRHIANTLQEGFSPYGGDCCRVSADNFAVLYPASFAESDEIAAIRQRAAHMEGLVVPIVFSIGRYRVDDLSLRPSAMYDRAALAAATIKGQYDVKVALYDEELRLRLLREQEIVTEMEAALREGQFEVWFQPQYNHATDAMIGAEALVRWRHPVRGLIPPAEFIPIFERNGFIYQLDQFVWEEVCRSLRKWIDQGRDPLPVSVNISRYDIYRADVVGVISGLVERYALPIQMLRLEITESAFGEAPARIVDTVKQLIGRGFTVEIDDFGSGYSSLNTLKDVPAQILKLDMRFLEHGDDNQRGGNIVESVVRMAKWLGMSVIAEGVETLAQADYLRSVGCTYLQGFLYAKPMSAPQYEAYCCGSEKEERLLALETVENLDNNAFWDADSMDTLIFNSYVGAACIYEYHNGRIELIRASEKFVQIIGSDTMTMEDALKLDWNAHLEEDCRSQLIRLLEESIRAMKEVTAELLFLALPSCPRETVLRSSMRVIAAAGDHYLVYCTNENRTAQRASELRERQAHQQLQAIMDNVDLGIIAAVVENGAARYLFANDVYYRLLGYTRETFENAVTSPYETVAPEDRDRVMEETERLNRDGASVVLEYAGLARDGSRRIFRADISLGTIVGIQAPVQLSILRDITAETEIARREQQAVTQLRAMMDDMPGGYVRMRADAAGICPVYMNPGFVRLTGMSEEALWALYGSDSMAGVHPEDVASVRAAAAEIIERGQASGARFRLIRGDGNYIWVQIFGRATRDAAGQCFLNIYYSDASEQVREETYNRELLDNLPYGTALYTLQGGNLSVEHLNRRYWELVGRPETDYQGAAFLDAVYPEDRQVIRNALTDAIRESRDVVCDIRVRSGGGSYRPFRIVGRILPRSRDSYAIYAVYTPLDQETMTVQEMLPMALGAMMDTQTEYSYVKDRNLRYLCCSRQAAAFLGLASPEEIRGKTDGELFLPALAELLDGDDRRVLEAGEAMLDSVVRIPAGDGDDRYISSSKYPLKDTAGNTVGLYGVSRDVTESREMRSKYELLTNSIPGGVITCQAEDGQIRITFFSDGFCRLFGLSREEYLRNSGGDVYRGIAPEDAPVLRQALTRFLAEGVPVDCVLRVRLQTGAERWIHCKTAAAQREGERITFHAVLFDVTRSQQAVERLRVSEEENRLAMRHTSNTVCRYDAVTGTLRLPESTARRYRLPELLENVPESQLRDGLISPETADVYMGFYAGIRRGEESGSATFRRLSPKGWRWLEGHYSTILDGNGRPVSAVVSFTDVTEQMEKEFAYKRWRQSLLQRPPASYTLLRCSLKKESTLDSREGELLTDRFLPGAFHFDESVRAYARRYVAQEDRARFTDALLVDALLAGFYQGRTQVQLEYRERPEGGSCRWLRLTVDLTEYESVSDVEAHVLFEDIDDAKRRELRTLEQASTDPLTGVLNRSTFAARMRQAVESAGPGVRHALLMLDIDGFKQVNDTFGHGVGDQTLVDIADAVRRGLRSAELFGRLGGDEFVVFLPNIAGDMAAAAKARQICAAARRAFSTEVETTGSIGIAMLPRDGTDFDTLYRKADAALYHVKATGRDSFAFYQDDMSQPSPQDTERSNPAGSARHRKPRMLIVDDSRIERAMISRIFEEQFRVERADNGREALIRLRHYGSSISVVLLDLVMPEMDGFAVLAKMRESRELQGIPVVVVSADESRETGLQAIREGALDYVSKPVDPELLRARVESAIRSGENQRLRVKNIALEYQNSEITRYKTALERSGVAVVENDWVSGDFSYDPDISQVLAGAYDSRGLWHILLSDFVAETGTVQKLQGMAREVATDRERQSGRASARLKGADGRMHEFRVCVSKTVDDFGLTAKLFLTFVDLGPERPEP